jgi:hypothetical protein
VLGSPQISLCTSSDRTFGVALSDTSHLGYIPSGYMPLSASKNATTDRRPNEEVRKCEQEVVRIRHRPSTTRYGPVSGRDRFRWLTVTLADCSSDLPRLAGRHGVVNHNRGSCVTRHSCQQGSAVGRSVKFCMARDRNRSRIAITCDLAVSAQHGSALGGARGPCGADEYQFSGPRAVSFEENFYVEFVLRVFLKRTSMLNLIADVLQVFLISYVMNFETTCCSPYSLLRGSPHFLRRCSPISLKFSPFPKKRRTVFYFDY